MLRRKETFTVIAPIPAFVPRQLALDILHSHDEVIGLNPLVLSFIPIPAPRDAAADEYYVTWYKIKQQVQRFPGLRNIGSGEICFDSCFHNMPWGLQTRTYAPMNVEIFNKYSIRGNQPGIEPLETRELGMEELGVPREGLYLRQDVEIQCNFAIMSLVKAQLKTASKAMVDRIIKKAELLDAGVLQATVKSGRLFTFNPNDKSQRAISSASRPMSPLSAPSPWSPLQREVHSHTQLAPLTRQSSVSHELRAFELPELTHYREVEDRPL